MGRGTSGVPAAPHDTKQVKESAGKDGRGEPEKKQVIINRGDKSIHLGHRHRPVKKGKRD